MADISAVIRTLGDVLTHSDLTPGNVEALEWAISELKTEPSGGPWHAEGWQVMDQGGHVLAAVPDSLGDMADDANRRLILAAPVLLEACRRAIHELMPGATIDPEHAGAVRGILQQAVYVALFGADPDQAKGER